MKYTTNDFFLYYIEMSGNEDCQKLFSAKENMLFLNSITEEQASCRYESEKWSVKQVLGHMTDHERIMTYRALRVSRKDKTPLAGYEQNDYVDNGRSDELTFKELVEDYQNVRNASISFMKGLSQEQWRLKGQIWKFNIDVEEIMRAVIGHEFHHINIIKERYLNM